MHMCARAIAEDIMRFVLQSHADLPTPVERALVVRLAALVNEVHPSERRQCENAALMASTLASAAVREMAAHVLALHGSPAAFAVLRFLASEAKVEREVRAAAHSAILAIQAREDALAERRETAAFVPWRSEPVRSNAKTS